jgi:hypothetical protein
MKSNESECKSEKNHMLTSFFARFNTSITKKEFDVLQKIAIRVESVLEEHERRRYETHILIGRHWVVIASKIIDDVTTQTIRIVLPCDSQYSVCVKEDEDESNWIFEFDDCIDIDLDEERYSNTSNEAWIRLRCKEETYRALFNVVIDPQYVGELDETILKLTAKYLGARDLPAMFRPM